MERHTRRSCWWRRADLNGENVFGQSKAIVGGARGKKGESESGTAAVQSYSAQLKSGWRTRREGELGRKCKRDRTRETERETETDRQTETETERQRQRQTETDRDRQTDRQREQLRDT
jgi:hypothetical protein